MTGRIAIMTWHHAENYGTAFQAYALKNAVEGMGYAVELIDYRRMYSAPLMRRSVATLIINKGRSMLRKNRNAKRAYFNFSTGCFGNFYDTYFTYTKKCVFNQEFDELNQIYDGFICGSDQIWGPEWFDARYFLDFVYDDRRKIAYAPSFGVSEIKDGSIRSLMKEYITQFAFLSVREQTGCSLAEELADRNNVFNALDPVLLLKPGDWKKIEQDVKLPDQRYMLVFFLKNNPDYFKVAIEAAEKKALEPIILHCTQSEDSVYANIGELTPGQLLRYINSSAYICTDSFHILVLSIIYSIQFKSFKKYRNEENNSKNTRITDLLNRLSIKNAEYEVGCSFEEKIEYNIVNEKLSELRVQSHNFLLSALSALPKDQLIQPKDRSDCSKNAACTDMYSPAFQNRLENTASKVELELLRRMKMWNFALNKKCYNCSNMPTTIFNSDKREPIFYSELDLDLLNDNMSLRQIYNKYYRSYDLPFRLRATLKKKIQRLFNKEL